MSVPARCADIGVGIDIGISALSGIEIGAGYRKADSDHWTSRFGVRANISSTDPLKSAIDSALDRLMRDGVDVGDGVRLDEGKLDAWHGALLADFYPFAGPWRLTGGYAWGGMDMDARVFGTVANAPADRFYFYLAGDHYFYNGNQFKGSVSLDWNYHGPYFGTGFDWRLFCGLALFFDIGAVVTNRPARMSMDIPHEQLYIYNTESGAWSPVQVPQLNTDVARATADANRKLSDYRLYPMIKLGFGYRFQAFYNDSHIKAESENDKNRINF